MDKEQRATTARLAITAILAGTAAACPMPAPAHILLYLAAYAVIGADIIYKALRNIPRGRIFDENFLMGTATCGAIALGEYPEAVAVMALYQLGEMLSDIAVVRSRASISALMDIRPETAVIEVPGGSTRQMPPTDVPIGSMAIVSPGEKIPLDGTIISGTTDIDASALTGESQPYAAAPGDKVLGGCINLTGAIRIKTTAQYADTTAAQILEMVENAETSKAHTEKAVTRLAHRYTPIVVAAAVLLAVLPPLAGAGSWEQWLHRALVFLVISCPCALVISVPLAFFAGIGGAARKGILFKGSTHIETMAKARAVAFDKTGTLTYGRFSVTAIHPETVSEEQLLELAALAESRSVHPVALSLRAAYSGTQGQDAVSDLHEHPGEGIEASIGGKHVYAGNERLMARAGVVPRQCSCTGTIIHISVDGTYMGHIAVADTPKPQSAQAIESLRKKGIHTVMLTGDKVSVAAAVAAATGIKEYHAGLMPDQKARFVAALAQQPATTPVAFVGDGINDAPVLKTADAGIAMGAAGSAAAIAAADIVLLNDDPLQVDTAIDTARKTMRIVRQNIILALAVKSALLAAGACGIAGMWAAVFADVGVTLAAVLNSLRAMRTAR